MRWPERLRALAGAIGPLLASLLLVASVVAPAHCLSRLGAFGERPVELCQPSALFGEAPQPTQGAHHESGICVVSAALAVAMLPDPPEVAAAATPEWHPAALRLAAARAPPLATFLSEIRPRAPPVA